MAATERVANDEKLIPRSITSLRDYSWQKFSQDLVSGVTVGLVALPLAMAFAISSGLDPKAGISCAIVAGFLISALGGSRLQIGGPTGAFVVVVSGIIAQHGVNGLFMCTLMAGVLLVILGLTKLGQAVKYIPRPVVLGFTNGIAVLIASTQIKDFFGLTIEKVPSDFLLRMDAIFHAFPTWNQTTTFLSAGALVVVILFAKFLRRIPGAIVALVLGTVIVALAKLPVDTIGSRFGGIPPGFPALRIPQFQADLILPLLAPAFTVAMLGAIESLLSAVVADKMSGDRHNPNMELVAQGVANIASPLVGGLPATGAIARTATNIRSGAQTPMSGMIHALTLLLVVLFAAPLAKDVPLGVLSAILFVVAYNMGEWKEIPSILRMGKADSAVWLITFALTVLADLTVAVQAGMILAVLIYIRRVTNTTTVTRIEPEYVQEGFAHSLQTNPIPEGVAAYRIHGPFLFGSTDKLQIIEDDLPTLPKVVMLRLRNMNAIDATGLDALMDLAEKLHKSDRQLVICGMRSQPNALMASSRFFDRLGRENVCESLEQAVARSADLLKS